MKVQAPVLSLEAHGGFGIYRFRGKIHPPFPYPIALYPSFFYPYGAKPEYFGHPDFFHFYGWYYQLRRTWHGIVWAAHKYTPPYNPQTPIQTGYRGIFAKAVYAWQQLTEEEKDYYRKLRYPVKASGYNRFIRQYLREHLHEGYPVAFYLLLETGDKILQENGYGILLE